MDLLLGTLTLRPYVFAFLAVYVAAASADLGWRRTLTFAFWVWPVALFAELASTRTGFPFGLYHYTGTTRARELFIADVPVMDPLSFAFLAYGAFCLARATLGSRRRPWWGLALLSGVLMMFIDVVVDPLAVRGDRWFLGRIFEYTEPGSYFGVPLSNFAGWILVGAVGVGGYLRFAGPPGPPRPGLVLPGIALYYCVVGFNLAVTAWLGEWALLLSGGALHAVLAVVLYNVATRATPTARDRGSDAE
jgi:putative membrane protein